MDIDTGLFECSFVLNFYGCFACGVDMEMVSQRTMLPGSINGLQR